MTNTVERKSQPWSFWPAIGLTFLIIILFLTIGIIVEFLCVRFLKIAPTVYAMESNGLFLSIATIATAATIVPAVFFLIKRRGIQAKEYLRLNIPSPQVCLQWIAALTVLAFCSDRLSIILGKPIVPDFMLNVYTTAGSIPLFVVALAIAAPVSEEVIFRGFLFRGIENSRLGGIGAIIISALWWASLHVQYDLYGMATVFVTGLFLGAVRLKTKSLCLPIIMHSLWSIISIVETALYVKLLRLMST